MMSPRPPTMSPSPQAHASFPATPAGKRSGAKTTWMFIDGHTAERPPWSEWGHGGGETPVERVGTRGRGEPRGASGDMGRGDPRGASGDAEDPPAVRGLHGRPLTRCPPRCQLCGFRCRQRASLTWHMRCHGGGGGARGSGGPPPLPCPRCPRCFRTPQGLKFHMRKSHREPPPEPPPQHLGDP